MMTATKRFNICGEEHIWYNFEALEHWMIYKIIFTRKEQKKMKETK